MKDQRRIMILAVAVIILVVLAIMFIKQIDSASKQAAAATGQYATTNSPAQSNGQYFDGKYYLLLNKSTNGTFTASVWVYYTTFNGIGVAISDGLGEDVHSIWYIGSGGEIGPKTSCGVFSEENIGNYTAGWRFAYSNFVGVGRWYNIVCVYNYTDITMYINGKLVNSTQTPYSVFGGRIIEIGKRTSAFYINNTQTFANFVGYIKNVQIYNKPMNSSEVEKLYNNYNPLGNVSVYVPLSGGDNYTYFSDAGPGSLERINSSS